MKKKRQMFAKRRRTIVDKALELKTGTGAKVITVLALLLILAEAPDQSLAFPVHEV